MKNFLAITSLTSKVLTNVRSNTFELNFVVKKVTMFSFSVNTFNVKFVNVNDFFKRFNILFCLEIENILLLFIAEILFELAIIVCRLFRRFVLYGKLFF